MKWMWRKAYQVVDMIRRTDAAGAYKKLIETEWKSGAELKALQLERLKVLLIHAQEHVPYYRRIFSESGFDARNFSAVGDLEKIPVLTKDDVRRHLDELKADHFEQWQPRKAQTGGSTGKPLVTYKDRGSHTYLTANNLRAWHAAGYEPGDKYITLAHGSLLPKTGSLKHTFYFLLQHSDLIKCYHMDEQTLTAALATIRHSRGRYMFGYSSSTYLLASFADKRGIPMSGTLDGLFTTSDMLYPHQRALIEKVFGAKVFDIYGCPEGGIISFECEKHQGYHLNQESAYVEIVGADASGQGRIVSTPLFNYAFPMIRYETGDVGSITTEPCACGRALPRIAQLGGRIRDFVVLSDGRHIHGAFFNHLEALYQSDWIEKYQVTQEALNHLVIKITCIRPPAEAELSLIRDSLHKGLMPDMQIDFDLSGVELAPSGKFRLIVSKVKTTWEK
jgi:phenylacetate-CoA ligase